MRRDTAAVAATPHTGRTARADGAATRAAILNAAGRVFAECGYAQATSKAICARARINMAAVNYHFGSRDGLYLAVLKATHQHMLGLDFISGLARRAMPAEEKLTLFIRGLVDAILDAGSWQTRVWARELLAPTSLLGRTTPAQALPGIDVLTGIAMAITGRRARDPALAACVVSALAPCLILLVADPRAGMPLQALYGRSAAALTRQLHGFALAGLRAAARHA